VPPAWAAGELRTQTSAKRRPYDGSDAAPSLADGAISSRKMFHVKHMFDKKGGLGCGQEPFLL
jgi:hypothetical protein